MNTQAHIPTTTTKAIRLVDTKQLSTTDWHSIRKQGIGSSDCAAALGLNPYTSMLELWMVKTGRLNNNIDSHTVTDDNYTPLYWGHKLEPLIAEYYTEKTGNKVRRVHAVLQHPHHDFMLANLDYEVVKSDEVQILECKSTGQHGAKLWKNGVPLYVICQVQHQLAVTGKQSAHICVLIAGHDAKVFKVNRDERLIAQIIKEEKQFWQYVIDDTPPPPDKSESARKALQALYSNHKPNLVINFKDNETANTLFDSFKQVDKEMKYLKSRSDELKHKLQAQIQDAETAIFNNGTVTWKRSKDSTSLDTKALLKQQPQLLDEFSKVRKGSRRFVVYSD